MTDLERIRAKFAAEYGLSEDMLRNAERWTETTGDLEGVPENLLPGILGMRFGAIAIDTRYCAVGTPCRCTSISMAADSLTDTRS